MEYYEHSSLFVFNIQKTACQLAQNIQFKKQGNIIFQKYQWHGKRTWNFKRHSEPSFKICEGITSKSWLSRSFSYLQNLSVIKWSQMESHQFCFKYSPWMIDSNLEGHMELQFLSYSVKSKKHFLLTESHPFLTTKCLHMYMPLTFISGFIFRNMWTSGDYLICFISREEFGSVKAIRDR